MVVQGKLELFRCRDFPKCPRRTSFFGKEAGLRADRLNASRMILVCFGLMILGATLHFRRMGKAPGTAGEW
jgi:hypothetical protein